MNSGQIVLLDHLDLQNQFLGLLWRGARIDHAPSEHDDYAALVARLVSVLHGAVNLDGFNAANRFAPDRSVAVDPRRDWLDQGSNDGLHPVGGSMGAVRRFWDDL